MAIDFPGSPSTGDHYSYDQRTWKWDGTAWVIVVSGTIDYNIDGGGATTVYGGQSVIDGGGVA